MVGIFSISGDRERSALEVEAKKRVGVEIVKRCPGPEPVVGEFRMGAVARNAVLFPLSDISL